VLCCGTAACSSTGASGIFGKHLSSLTVKLLHLWNNNASALIAGKLDASRAAHANAFDLTGEVESDLVDLLQRMQGNDDASAAELDDANRKLTEALAAAARYA
jgi:hypothetical protein